MRRRSTRTTRSRPASLTPEVAGTAKQLLGNVVSGGTGTNAARRLRREWGKTGTTDDNGDAWFCGATEARDRLRLGRPRRRGDPDATEYGGAPVDGGTIPALIWRDVMIAWEEIRAANAAEADAKDGDDERDRLRFGLRHLRATGSLGYRAYSAPAPETDGGGSGGGGASGNAPAAPAPEAAPAAPAPSGGGASTGGGISPG